MTDASLLPFNATPQERALGRTVAQVSDIPVPVRSTWDPMTCPASLLPWLAWAFSVNEWDSEWSTDRKRQVIADQALIHKKKGTIASIKRALESAGYPGAQIVEGYFRETYNGEVDANGTATYGSRNAVNWAYYRIKLPTPISNAQAEQVRRILANTAPARCVLQALDFDEVAATYNAAISFDGAFNFGIVGTA